MHEFDNEDVQQAFTKRTIRLALLTLLFLFMAGAFVGWYFFSEGSDNQQYSEQAALVAKVTENPHTPGTPRSGVYNFFYKMFGGIERGLENNPNNLDNVDHIDDLNSTASFGVTAGGSRNSKIATMVNLNSYYDSFENIDDGVRHSLRDVVGSAVLSKNGDKAGEVHDVIIDIDTGDAMAIVVQQDGRYYDRDLALLKFDNIYKQNENGRVRATITEDKMEDKKEFIYPNLNESNYISLRDLRDGQVIDFEGNVAGQIDAVIYKNAELQKVYFSLTSSLSLTGKPLTFGIPYEAVNVVKNADGYDIKLTKKQTISLAERLYGTD